MLLLAASGDGGRYIYVAEQQHRERQALAHRTLEAA